MRAARITDRQARVELSRRVHTSADSYRRSLGVPAPSATLPRISMAALIPSWLPLRPASLHLVVGKSYYLNVNARLQLQAMQLGSGKVMYLDPEEAKRAAQSYERSWDFWKSRLPVR